MSDIETTGSSEFEMVATTNFGLENVLADEIKQLNANNIEIQNRAVKYSGTTYLLYQSNLHLRTAIRILIPISSFYIKDHNELYKKIMKFEWDQYFSKNQTFAIDANTHSTIFTHSKYATLKAKDAIADWFRNKYNKRPDIDLENPDFKLNLLITQNTCYLSIDSSGKPLGKRGYRTEHNLAPISENLASGIIMLSQWQGKNILIDPMCGSGTFAIEAALIESNTPPGLKRKFTFQNWLHFDNNLWKKVKEDAIRNIYSPKKTMIYAMDKNEDTINIARFNARRAGVEKMIRFRLQDFFKTKSPGRQGTVIINPPYGERMHQQDIITFYKAIGKHLKNNYQNHDSWIISANLKALKNIGMKASNKIKLYNGPLECRLHYFKIHDNSDTN